MVDVETITGGVDNHGDFMYLLHSPADILRWALIALDVVTRPSVKEDWPCYTDNEPASPDEVVTVINTAGVPGVREMLQGEIVGPFAVQIRVRGVNPKTGFVKANAIRDELATGIYHQRVTIDTAEYIVGCVTRITNVFSAGKESPVSERNILTINAAVSITRCH